MMRMAAATAPRCRYTLQRNRASPWMPNERSSSFSSSYFCFCASLSTLYDRRCVSWGPRTSYCVSCVRRPLIRSCGCVPLVMCRSDAPRSTMSCSRSAMLAAMRSPRRERTRSGQGDPEDLFDRRRSVDDLQEPRLPQRPHALRLRDRPQLRRLRPLEDRLADLVGDRHDLVDRDPPLHPGEVAGRAALALVELDLARARRHVAVGGQGLLVRLVRLLALHAHLPAEALDRK